MATAIKGRSRFEALSEVNATDLSRFEEAVVIGFTDGQAVVIVKPRGDGTVNKSLLVRTLKTLIAKLERGGCNARHRPHSP